jgi:hypothetical protein
LELCDFRTSSFYAGDYHQQYLAKNPEGYCGLKGTGVSCEQVLFNGLANPRNCQRNSRRVSYQIHMSQAWKDLHSDVGVDCV